MKILSDTYSNSSPLCNLHFNNLRGIYSVRSKSLFNSLADTMENKIPNTAVRSILWQLLLAHGEKANTEIIAQFNFWMI